MQKVCSLFLGLIILLMLGACHSGQQKNNQSGQNDTTVVKLHLTVSDTLSAKMNVVLNTYYQLKDAFVKTDSVAADSAAKMLSTNIQVLSLNELQSDPKRYDKAKASLKSLKGEITGLLGENTIKGKREEFQMISDIMYDLISSVGLKGQTVYHDFCPMFNDGKGAYWLSNFKRINNPYYGDEMLGCGEIKETIQF